MNFKKGEMETVLIRARIDSGLDRGTEAQRAFEEVIAYFEKTSQPFDTAKACYYYADALAEQSQPDRARIYYQKARAVFERIGAQAWLDRLDKKIRQ
jgi:tetratricopeptide (TPR) repeat protein